MGPSKSDWDFFKGHQTLLTRLVKCPIQTNGLLLRPQVLLVATSNIKANNLFRLPTLGGGDQCFPQVLAGPAFIAVFTVSGVLLGLAADYVHRWPVLLPWPWLPRLRLLACAVLVYSLATCLTGLATHYWHLVLLRMLLAAGEAACSPVMVSLLTDLFPAEARGTATGILHFGVYLGFGLSQGLGIHLTRANLLGFGWRPVFLVAGLPGVVLAMLLLSVPDPRRRGAAGLEEKVEQVEETLCLQVSEKVDQDNNNCIQSRCGVFFIRSFTSSLASLKT